jgi:HEAT repeat protein
VGTWSIWTWLHPLKAWSLQESRHASREIVLDPAYGDDARVALTLALGKTRDAESGEVLMRLIDEPLLAPYAAKAMGRRGDEAGRSKIEALLHRPEAWVRKEAERALKNLDKKAARRGGNG